jgi:hypothetical protein
MKLKDLNNETSMTSIEAPSTDSHDNASKVVPNDTQGEIESAG